MNREVFKGYLISLLKEKNEAMMLILADREYSSSVISGRYVKGITFVCQNMDLVITLKRVSDKNEEPIFEVIFSDLDEGVQDTMMSPILDLPNPNEPFNFTLEDIELKETKLNFKISTESIFFDADGHLCRNILPSHETILSYDVLTKKIDSGSIKKSVGLCNSLMKRRQARCAYIPFRMSKELRNNINALALHYFSKIENQLDATRVQDFLTFCETPHRSFSQTPMSYIISKIHHFY